MTQQYGIKAISFIFIVYRKNDLSNEFEIKNNKNYGFSMKWSRLC